MNDVTEDMFSKIQSAFDNSSRGGGQFSDILRFKPESTTEVRLLPYLKELEKTVFYLPHHKWTSKATGKLIEAIDPSIIGEPNPIQMASNELSQKLKSRRLDKDHPEMVEARQLWKKRNWLYNVYVIDDPVNPENNGKVKILKAGEKLQELIQDHFNGKRKDDFGSKIFSLKEDGCNLKIISSEKNKMGMWNYDGSFFTNSRAIPDVSDDSDKIEEILESCFDLSTVFPIKSQEELTDMVNIHFFNKINSSTDASNDNNVEENEENEETGDDLDKVLTETNITKSKTNDVEEDDLEKMLQEMGIDG